MPDIELGLRFEAGDAAAKIRNVAQAYVALIDEADEAQVKTDTFGSSLRSLGQAATGLNQFTDLAAKVASLGREFVQAAEAADRHHRALTALGGAYELVRVATNETVTAEEALAAQQSLTQSGIRVTADQLAVITRRAREYARATGTETTQAINQLTDALRGGEAEGLRRFGLSVQQGADRVTTFNHAIDQMRHAQEGALPAQRTLSEEVSRTGGYFRDLVGSAVTWADDLLGIRGTLSLIGDSLRDLGESADQTTARLVALQHQAQGASASASLSMHQQTVNFVRDQLRSAGVSDLSSLASVGTQLELTQRGSRLYGGQSTDLANLSDAQLQRVAEILARRRGRAQTAREEGATEIDDILMAADDARADGLARQSVTDDQNAVAAGVRDRRDEARRRRMQRRIDREARRQGVDVPGGERSTRPKKDPLHHDRSFEDLLRRAGGGEGNDANLESALSIINGTNTENAEQSTGLSNAFGAGLDQIIAATQTVKTSLEEVGKEGDGAANKAATAARSIADSQLSAWSNVVRVMQSNVELTETSAQRMANSVQSAYQAATGSFRSHVQALIEGRESFGEALRGFTHDVMVQVATESTVQAVFESAKAIASIATGDYPGAALHGAAAAAYAATAALTGIGAALTNAPAAASAAPTGGPPSNARTLGSGARDGGSGGGSVNVTLNISGVLTNEQTSDVIHGHIRDLRSRGML